MVKRLFLLSLMVLALCGASVVIPLLAVPPAALAICRHLRDFPLCVVRLLPIIPQVKEEIVPVPAQLRKVRVVAPYLAGVAWPRTPLAFFGNPQTFPNPIALGRYEWLVPAVEVKNEHFDTFMDPCCKTHQGSPLRVREG